MGPDRHLVGTSYMIVLGKTTGWQVTHFPRSYAQQTAHILEEM